MNTIAEVSRETLLIEAYLKNLNSGDKIPYAILEKETKVKMDNRGKQFMRSAMRRLKLEYTCIRGIGIELCSAINATGIIAHKVIGIDKAVKRANKTTKNVINQFDEQLSNEDRLHVYTVRSMLAPITSYSKSARLFFQKPDRKSIN